eukprot:752938-Hanusia_phi.AAC.4
MSPDHRIIRDSERPGRLRALKAGPLRPGAAPAAPAPGTDCDSGPQAAPYAAPVPRLSGAPAWTQSDPSPTGARGSTQCPPPGRIGLSPGRRAESDGHPPGPRPQPGRRPGFEPRVVTWGQVQATCRTASEAWTLKFLFR